MKCGMETNRSQPYSLTSMVSSAKSIPQLSMRRRHQRQLALEWREIFTSQDDSEYVGNTLYLQ